MAKAQVYPGVRVETPEEGAAIPAVVELAEGPEAAYREVDLSTSCQPQEARGSIALLKLRNKGRAQQVPLENWIGPCVILLFPRR